MNILEFSDELLCMILEYVVKGEDKIAVSKTCCRFKNLMSDRKLLKKVNFSRACHVPFADIKQLVKVGGEFVVELNLTSCYLLKSADILSIAKKLVNLRHFFVADTKLTWEHLVLLFKENKQITKLSLTWHPIPSEETHYELVDTGALQNIESLFIFILPGDRGNLLIQLNILSLQLQELWIFHLECMHSLDFIDFSPTVSRCLVICCLNCTRYSEVYVASEVNSMARKNVDWDCFILDYRRKDMFSAKSWSADVSLDNIQNARAICVPGEMHVENSRIVCDNVRFASANVIHGNLHAKSHEKYYPKLQQLRIFSTEQFEFCQHLSLPQLKEVYLAGENHSFCGSDLTALKRWTRLTKLCIPIEILKVKSNTESKTCASSSVQVASEFCSKKRRVAKSVAESSSQSLLRDLRESSPDLQELSIEGCHICHDGRLSSASVASLSPLQAESELLHVALWHRLERLAMSYVPIRDGSFLLKVAQLCPNLWSLHLSNLGLKGLCTYRANLVEALPVFKNLKDFRLYQKHLGDITSILDALKKCPKLDRLSIICFSNADHKLKKETVENFVREAGQLRLLFLFLGSATLGINNAKYLQKLLNSLQKSRPSFVANIQSYNSYNSTSIDHEVDWLRYVWSNFRNFSNLPLFHLVEMVFQPCLVKAVPMPWESYSLFS